MKTQARLRLAVVACSLLLAHGSMQARAQSTTRPIEIVVPFPPGGPLDQSARVMAERWSEALGQPVIVSNRAGGGTTVGGRYVAGARPDGHVLMVVGDSSINLAALRPEAGYGLDSFDYILAYGVSGLFFVVRADAPWQDLAGFVQAARRRPDEMTYGSYGMGTLGHIVPELFWRSLGISVTHVPFRSSPEANLALQSRQVDMSVPSTVQALRQGTTTRVIATTAAQRLAFAPDIPTLRELGYDISFEYYAVLVGPRGLNPAVMSRLAEANSQAMARYGREITTRLNDLELMPINLDGPATERLVRGRDALFRDIVPRLGLGN